MASKTITIPLEITEDQADDLALFVKRIGWTEFRQNAQDENQAYAIRDAAHALQKALAAAGFSPR
jgi:dissimilatory sulfite reductase (desulfoviridin) alpha/beta subunit